VIWVVGSGLGACFAGCLWLAYCYGKYVGQHRERCERRGGVTRVKTVRRITR
jgi:hypothetical protein